MRHHPIQKYHAGLYPAGKFKPSRTVLGHVNLEAVRPQSVFHYVPDICLVIDQQNRDLFTRHFGPPFDSASLESTFQPLRGAAAPKKDGSAEPHYLLSTHGNGFT